MPSKDPGDFSRSDAARRSKRRSPASYRSRGVLQFVERRGVTRGRTKGQGQNVSSNGLINFVARKAGGVSGATEEIKGAKKVGQRGSPDNARAPYNANELGSVLLSPNTPHWAGVESMFAFQWDKFSFLFCSGLNNNTRRFARRSFANATKYSTE